MKKETKKIKNGYIVTTSRSEGNYSTINNNLLNDTRLTDSAVRLMIMLINIPPNQKISMTYYRKKLGWGTEKLAKVTKQLAELGYIKGIQYPQGDFKHHYNVDETGALKPSYDENNNVIVLKNSTKPYSKTKHHKKTEIQIENPKVGFQPELEVEPTKKIIDYLMTNVPIDVLENYEKEYGKIGANSSSYKDKVNEIESLSKKIKLECYNFNFKEVKESLSKASPAASKKFIEWLKNEIFNKFNFDINPSNKLTHFKQQNPNKSKVKMTYEDKLQMISEEPND